jgi:hypothetical protein
MLDIWTTVDGKKQIQPLMAKIFRFVESQEQAATLSLVNNIYEQDLLEDLIEANKRSLPQETDSLHYLLKTPFRYPPLQHGSRFGTCYEQGIFYGSLTLPTALAETAYYRFVYMLGPVVPFKSPIFSTHSSFSVTVKSNFGIFLDSPPFNSYERILTSPSCYIATQQLGTQMRQEGVEVFRYTSARDKHQGKNMALLTHKAFYSHKPTQLAHWLCQTSLDEVGFLAKETKQKALFLQRDFWVNGQFPSPAV